MASADVAVLLTGVGKRYDIVSAFAQHATVIAADPNPLAPGLARTRSTGFIGFPQRAPSPRSSPA